MKARDLLKLIPEQDLEFIAAKTNVDHQVKKLDGVTMFKLILFSLLHNQNASLRIMEHLYHSMKFRMFCGLENETTKYNSIRDRITTIKADFFETLFFSVFDRFNSYFKEQEAILRYDSTMIAISTNLIEWGMKVGGKNTHVAQIKYTIATKGSFPCYVKVFDKPEELCEDKTIPVTIMESDISKTGIIVFDRGVQERKAFERMSQSDRLFVTRVKTDVRYREIKKMSTQDSNGPENATVKVEEDIEVLLKNRKEKWTEESFRLIKTSQKENGESIYFLTNIFYLSAHEIAFIYKQRWEVEVYFKYLKQHLNLKHLVSRNENGIKVMIYMTLILSILLIAFKKLNKLESFKIAKLKFSLELEQSVVKQIVLLTGGNPNKMAHLFSDA